jgi:hypothetical protein
MISNFNERQRRRVSNFGGEPGGRMEGEGDERARTSHKLGTLTSFRPAPHSLWPTKNYSSGALPRIRAIGILL